MYKEKKKKGGFLNSIKESPINYFSDLFICAMVVFWIIDNVYESIIASAVTISSIILSFRVGYSCFEVSMWSSIGSNIAMPLASGGAIWMIKNGVQHAIANHNGKQAHMDFPAVNAEGEMDGKEKPMVEPETSEKESEGDGLG